MTFVAALFCATTLLLAFFLVVIGMGAADIVKKEQDRTDRLAAELDVVVTDLADEVAAHDKTRDQLHAAVAANVKPLRQSERFDRIASVIAFNEASRNAQAIENHANGDHA